MMYIFIQAHFCSQSNGSIIIDLTVFGYFSDSNAMNRVPCSELKSKLSYNQYALMSWNTTLVLKSSTLLCCDSLWQLPFIRCSLRRWQLSSRMISAWPSSLQQTSVFNKRGQGRTNSCHSRGLPGSGHTKSSTYIIFTMCAPGVCLVSGIFDNLQVTCSLEIFNILKISTHSCFRCLCEVVSWYFNTISKGNIVI